MKQVLDSLCNYRRYCWNKAIECWNDQYESRKIGLSQSLIDKLQNENGKLTVVEQELVNQYPTPSYYTVREELVRQKKDWQYELSSRVLQQAVKDVAKAWNLFFNNQDTAGRPTFKTKKSTGQGFKTDRASIRNGKLLLDKPHCYRGKWYAIKFKGLSIPEGKITYTQRCSACGFIKTGDDKITLSGNQKHGTHHNEYICYHCGYKDDRDHNAVLNLLALAK